mgnify:FL=1
MKRRFITSLTSIIIVSLILTIGTISVQAAEKNENKINQNLSIKNGNADFIIARLL